MEMRDRQSTLFSISQSSSSVLDAVIDVFANMAPFWVAVLLGLFVGWIWKPQWVSLFFLGVRGRHRLLWTNPPGLGVQRFWFALTASVTVFQMLKECWLKFKAWKWPVTQADDLIKDSNRINNCADDSASNPARNVVDYNDLRDLYLRYHNRDGGVPWEPMMERSIPGMFYQAWRRDPQDGGPTQYRSRTIFEDVTPEIVKDFYWDDEFRHKWDDMIILTKSLESCTATGAEIAHWIRKFPFFCSDREYIIGRRIYESEGTFFCITKGVPYCKVPRQKKPRRVDVYSSCWCIRAGNLMFLKKTKYMKLCSCNLIFTVESQKTGLMTACEVVFLHSEDMGIQRDIAKLGVRQGMWNCVRKMEPGLRKYIAHRKSCATLSFSASMAKLVTRVPLSMLESSDIIVCKDEGNECCKINQQGKGWKWVVVGGAVVLACGIDKGIVGKMLVFGLARRLSRLGRRL